LISYNQAVPSLSDLNLDDLQPPLPGGLPTSEPQWCEVLQQADKQVTCHKEAAA
jgi:hypothetical protein